MASRSSYLVDVVVEIDRLLILLIVYDFDTGG
jgi:hypothetical protein